jgi:predicted GNAT family acetyltransferase
MPPGMSQDLAEQVRDDPERRRFELAVDGHTAFTTYVRAGSVVTFLHAEVPEVLGGRGVGSALVAGALAAVRARGEKVVPLCPFVASYMSRHAEVQDLLHDGSA